MIKHQIISLYGKSLSKLMKRHLILDKFFFNTIIFLELRLITLVRRMFFFFSFSDINKEIYLGNITVNNKKKHRNFLVRVGSVIKYNLNKKGVNFFYKKTFFKKNLNRLRGWYWKNWKKWKKKKNISSLIFIFKKIKVNLILNYIETLYNLKMGILLYKPILGEILLANKKRMLSLRLVKSNIFFLFF